MVREFSMVIEQCAKIRETHFNIFFHNLGQISSQWPKHLVCEYETDYLTINANIESVAKCRINQSVLTKCIRNGGIGYLRSFRVCNGLWKGPRSYVVIDVHVDVDVNVDVHQFVVPLLLQLSVGGFLVAVVKLAALLRGLQWLCMTETSISLGKVNLKSMF